MISIGTSGVAKKLANTLPARLIKWVAPRQQRLEVRSLSARPKARWQAPKMNQQLCQAAGREVSLAYVYRLLHRHGWRKLGPHPRHVKAERERQEEFKKNSPRCSGQR